jgi:hypothetical protein
LALTEQGLEYTFSGGYAKNPSQEAQAQGLLDHPPIPPVNSVVWGKRPLRG